MRVVIVGAGLAGARTAEALRAAGHLGPVVLIGAEDELPYDRPPLSKSVLAGTADPGELVFRDAPAWKALDVELLLGHSARALDPLGRTVHLADGTAHRYDQLVIATGARARALPGSAGIGGVHVLRTIEDTCRIRAALRPGGDVVVVGGGVLGCEIAATLSGTDQRVAVVEPLPGPMWSALGGHVSDAVPSQVAAWHRRHGVRTWFGRGVERLLGGGDGVEGVRLTDGTALPADLVVAAVGAVPDTAWLDGSGVLLDDGVVCAPDCAVLASHGTRLEGVWAVGDVARVRDGAGSSRGEHWTDASLAPQTLAANLLRGPAERRPYAHGGYFWSEQYGMRLQVLGRPGDADEVHVLRARPDAFLAVYGCAGRLVAVVAAGHPGAIARARSWLATRPSIEEAVALWA